MSTGHVLTVCTGNVCRSPVMERVLQAAVDERWGPGAIEVSSAGTHALVGEAVDTLALRELTAMGADGTGFAARRLESRMVRRADLVLTATRRHRSAVVQLHPQAMRRTFAVLDLADTAAHLGVEDLPDTDDPGTWLREVVATAAARRGLTPPLSAQDADVVDPYRRAPEVYQQMGRQLGAALPAVAWLLTGRSPGRSSDRPSAG